MSEVTTAGEELPIDPSLVFARSQAPALRALAGPGTGKTYALVRRLTHLLEIGVDPKRILVVTFARTAARDLVSAAASIEAADGALVPRTLHSFCFSLLGREHVLQATGRVPRILLEFERDLLLSDLDGPFGGLRDRRKLLLAFEAAWARHQAEDPGQPVPGLDQSFQDALLSSLRWHRSMLVGEVVPIALTYLSHNPMAEERTAYDHVLVDEYQDLNRAEQEVLNRISAESNLAVIGDDDQSIYGFKCANPEGIRDFPEDHPETEDVQFVICRRCPQRVVDMAQTLIQRNPGRVRLPLRARDQNPVGELHHVQWRSIDEEAGGLADFIRHKVENGINPGKVLVLANRRQIGYAIRDAVCDRGIEASSFFREELVDGDRAQEVVTLLTLLADPSDRVALRTWLALGSTTQRRPAYRRLLGAARASDLDVADVLRRLDEGELALAHTAGAVQRWRELQDQLRSLREVEDDLSTLVDRLIPTHDDELRPLRAAADGALEDAEDLRDLAGSLRYGVAQRETPLEATEVRVMSMHASKGLTADLVILAGLVEGLLPSIDRSEPLAVQDEQAQEQRRLFFVALTRTTNILVFSSTRSSTLRRPTGCGWSEELRDTGHSGHSRVRSSTSWATDCRRRSRAASGPTARLEPGFRGGPGRLRPTHRLPSARHAEEGNPER